MPTAKPPAAARRYMEEFEETEAEFREWLARQKRAFDAIEAKNTDLAGWLSYKMGCTPRAAATVVQWAGLE